MNWMAEREFHHMMARWFADEFPQLQYYEASAWWGFENDVVCAIGYEDYGLRVLWPGWTDCDPRKPTFFDDIRAALKIYFSSPECGRFQH